MKTIPLFALLLLLITQQHAAHAAEITVTSVRSGSWSDKHTWTPQMVPGDNTRVVVNSGHRVVYDANSASDIVEIQVYGEISFDRTRNTQLDVGSVVVFEGGHFEVGSETSPIPADKKATIRFADLSTVTYTHNHGQPRLAPVLHAHGGAIDIHGAPRLRTWSRLAAAAPAGSAHITVSDPVDWKVGDWVAIGGTNKLGTRATSQCTLPSLNMACLDPSQFQHENVRITAVLGPGTFAINPALRFKHDGATPRQAVVELLTRNVVIMNQDITKRHGHIHVAHAVDTSNPVKSGAVARVSFARLEGLGRQEPGVYPLHFHKLGNAGHDSYAVGNAVLYSTNVFIRVHGTNFSTVRQNVGYSGMGNGIATEDTSEMFNHIDSNAVMATLPGAKTNPNDPTDPNEGDAFWMSNAHNIVTGNIASDTSGWGLHIAVPIGGKSIIPVDEAGTPSAPIDPAALSALQWEDNTTMSNFLGGMEVRNLRPSEPTTIHTLYATDGRTANFALSGGVRNVCLEDAQLQNGGKTGTFYEADVKLYGELKAAPPSNLCFRGGRIPTLHVGYQSTGYIFVDKVSVDTLRRGSEADGELVLVFRDLPNRLKVIAANGMPGTIAPHTTQHEMYFINYDGPGRNVKVIPEGMQAPDRFVYRLSSRFGTGKAGDWQGAYREASYSTVDSLPLPIRIDAGNRPAIWDGAPIAAWGHTDSTDDKGQPWWLDHPYMSSPSGLGLPRYGYSGASVPESFPSDATVQSNPLVSPLTVSARCGLPFYGLQYRIDVPNGRYRVTLGFQETWTCPKPVTAGPGGTPRVFDVKAEGVTVLHELNVYGEAGTNPLWKTFDADVTDGQLTLDFVNGYGFVSAIQIDRAP